MNLINKIKTTLGKYYPPLICQTIRNLILKENKT